MWSSRRLCSPVLRFSSRHRIKSLQTMRILCILLILVYFNNEIDSRDIEVLNSGLMNLSKDDMIVVFFVTIHHHGDKARNIIAKMVECCEKVTDYDTDCNLIQLHGEHLGTLQPGSIRNLTFLYPNLYGYNRRGSCIIGIWNQRDDSGEDSNEIRHKIEFDTSIRLGGEEIPSYLQGLYSPDKTIRCDTTDLDPFDGCNPVDCRLKYSGLRNYFNRKQKRCQKVPICSADPKTDLPDILYVPNSNTCRNLKKFVTEEDIKTLLQERYVVSGEEGMPSKKVNIQCHHGEMDTGTGLCVCDKGWTSEPFDPDAYNEGTSVYHMCDKKCHPDDPSANSKIPLALGIFLGVWIFIVVILCESCSQYFESFKRADNY